MIDKNSATPIYIQISDKLRQRIDNGEFKVGDLIPSENVLSQKYEVSRMTTRQAINNLVDEGYLYRKRGKGTYVADFKMEYNAYKLKGFTEEMLQFNKRPVNKIVTFEIRGIEEKIANKLQISKSDKVYFIERIRCIEEKPVVFERTYMPVKMFPELKEEIFKGSKYKYIESQKKQRIKESLQEIVPEIVEEPIRTFLSMRENEPILKVKSTTTFENGDVFEYTETYFKTRCYKFIQKASRF